MENMKTSLGRAFFFFFLKDMFETDVIICLL
jgi:hypothetical protein